MPQYLIVEGASVVDEVEAINPEEAVVQAAGRNNMPLVEAEVRVYELATTPEGNAQYYTPDDLQL